MVINYLGKQFFKIKLGEMTLAINPPSKAPKGTKSGRFGANIALLSVNHPSYNGVENVTYGDTKPFIISGPGEYEVKGVFVRGVASPTEVSKKKYINTVYMITLDDIKLCFLGATSSPQLTSEVKELCSSADVIFVPLSSPQLSADKAYNLAQSLDPKIIIPMDYDDPKDLRTFLKEGGDEKKKPVDKLQLKKKDLAGKEAEIVVLSH